MGLVFREGCPTLKRTGRSPMQSNPAIMAPVSGSGGPVYDGS